MLRFGTVPTLLMSTASRSAIKSAQQDLIAAQTEVGTGRHHDVGLVLGGRIGSSVGLRMKLDAMQRASESAEQASIKAGVAQTALGSTIELAQSFQSTLLGARGASGGQKLIREAAAAALQSLTGLINTTFDGRYLFGGINTDVPPLREFSGGVPEAAVTAAFLAHFGIGQNDPGVSQITGADMDSFIGGALSGVFSPVDWRMNWSEASDENLLQRATDGTPIDVAFSSNSAFVPKLTEAFAMMMSLGQGQLSAAAFEKTVDKSLALLVEAQRDIGAEQSRLGISQQVLKSSSRATEKLTASTLEAIRALESVDPYEAATRVNALMTQLESSYAVTGRISRMSLLNYI